MAGDDILWGSEGHDVLYGGTGADLFVFQGAATRRDLAPSADQLADFDPLVDGLVFTSNGFAGLHATGSGLARAGTTVFAIDAADFAVQTTKVAASLAVRVIYDQDDGLLYYDADGALSGYRAVAVAEIGVGLTLTAADIFVI
jgi:Ca2+-binding RTX toxin-like protein